MGRAGDGGRQPEGQRRPRPRPGRRQHEGAAAVGGDHAEARQGTDGGGSDGQGGGAEGEGAGLADVQCLQGQRGQ